LDHTINFSWVRGCLLVVGKTEPQRIFELLGQKGEVAPERLALRDAYVEALNAYRGKAWEKASAGFEACLAITPCDPPSKLFLERIAQFRVTAPCVVTKWPDGVRNQTLY
jgi:hypothetical protein